MFTKADRFAAPMLLIWIASILGVGAQLVQYDFDGFGTVTLRLTPAAAPVTVANFLGYVDRKDYDDLIIHRSPPNFIVQGGLAALNVCGVGGPPPPLLVYIPVQPAIVNEFNQSNVRGTIAMAKVGGDPDSATSQWFFNVGNNGGVSPSGLDFQNCGFTVFGAVEGNGMDVIDAINAVPIYCAGAPFSQIPLVGYAGGCIAACHVVHINTVREIPEPLLSDQLIIDLKTEFMAINSVEGETYQLQVSTDDMGSWANDGAAKNGTDTVIVWPFPTLSAEQKIFYRVEYTE